MNPIWGYIRVKGFEVLLWANGSWMKTWTKNTRMPRKILSIRKQRVSKDYSSVQKPYRELSSIYYVFQIENSWRFLIISFNYCMSKSKKFHGRHNFEWRIAWRMQRKPLDQVVEHCINKAVIEGSIQVGNYYF